jgi:hypothetical protein
MEEVEIRRINERNSCAKRACTLMVTDSWISVTLDFLVISLQADLAGAILDE